MVFCTYCGHSFTRDEHLERHILTHTNVKPFKCFTCHMSFARRDLLQRHYTVHGRNQDQQEIPAANGMIPKSAGRTPIACSNCAKTKTKCDKKFPCSRCASRNLRCTLRPTRRSTKNAARMGLITAETLAQGLANGDLPPDQTIAAEKVAIPHHHSTEPEPAPQSQSSPSLPHDCSKSASPSSPSVSLSGRNSIGSDDVPPPHFDQYNGCTTPPAPQGLSPTTPVSGMEFDESTPFPGSTEYAQSYPKSAAEDNPRFMLDWEQLQMPMDFDTTIHPDMLHEQDINFDLGAMALGPNLDPTLSLQTNFMQTMPPPLMTPIETPKIERTYSEAELYQAGIIGPHTRQMSQVSLHSADDSSAPMDTSEPAIDPVIQAQDGWTTFRCVPTIHPTSCPTTARWNLETLEHSLKNHKAWASWAPELEESHFDVSENLVVMQLHESTRDKLLAITQGFLHKTLEIHRGTQGASYSSAHPASNFILLPPTKILEYLLRSYANSFERYYPVTGRGALDANELMHCFHDRTSSLLILLMIAHGAMNIPSIEARSLTGGLVETCRISLFDLIERNIAMASDHNVLHAALLFVELGSWSGDKWQMDIAYGQRGIYTAMLKHSGMLEKSLSSSELDPTNVNQDHRWTRWLQLESRSRLVYSWAMVDQEVSLFNDAAPTFSVTEFGVCMPHSEQSWQAKSSGEWASIIDHHQDPSIPPETKSDHNTLSLKEMFRIFLDDEVDSLDYPLTAIHIRLLLQPLQSMVSHYGQLMSCFSDAGSSRVKNKTVTASSTRCRLEEVQCLLQRWHNLAVTYLRSNTMCPVMQASLVLYHLICLNTVTEFPQIERLARREGFDGTYQTLVWTHKRCISDVGEAIFHCGQVLRVIRAMPQSIRPAWWSAAVYRVALVLWCDSLINKDGTLPTKAGQILAVDSLPHDHPLLLRYLNKGEGIPCLTKIDGTTVALDHAITVLGHCIDLIDEGVSTRFQEGIRGKLDRLMRS